MSFRICGRNGVFVGGTLPLWYWRYRRRVAVAGYLYQCVADDWSIALAPPVPFCFISTPRPKTVTGAVSLNGAEECAGGVGGAISYDAAKQTTFIADGNTTGQFIIFLLLYVYFM